VALELRGVSKRYRPNAPFVVDQLNLSLPDGSLATIHGANGCGKSTLLRLTGEFLRLTSGRLNGLPAKFGYLPDRALPPARMTAQDYLSHLARLAGSPGAAKTGLELTERLGLSPGPSARLGTLSRGNLQKLLLAQALMRPVSLAILDEPLTGLDAAASATLHTLIAERLADGCAFLVATHEADLDDLGEVYLLSDGHLSRSA